MTTKVKRGFFKIRTESGSAVADTRFFPIVPITWRDELSPAIYDLFWQWRDEHLVDQVRQVVFISLIDNLKPPSATTRKYLADRSKADPRLAATAAEFMQVMVVTNPLLRGVLTAVNWMTGKEALPMEYQPTLAKGIVAAKRLLDVADVSYPDIDPDKYEFAAPSNDNEYVAIYSSP